MHIKAEGGGKAFDRAQPDFFFPARFNLLEKVLRKIGDLGHFLLGQAMTLAQFTQAKSDFLQGCHTSDRRGSALTFLPAITCIYVRMGKPIDIEQLATCGRHSTRMSLDAQWSTAVSGEAG